MSSSLATQLVTGDLALLNTASIISEAIPTSYPVYNHAFMFWEDNQANDPLHATTSDLPSGVTRGLSQEGQNLAERDPLATVGGQ